MRVDVSQAAATLAVVLHLPNRPFFVSNCPPATKYISCELKSKKDMTREKNKLKSRPFMGKALNPIFR